ncbi:thiopeptide-type bacteriocin biosynthesis protein [Streptomyces sp. NPDC058409]|uniref:thiopeptide-type bacteriocin biosynthesis protein n=1 Tax=Streptomyces sp. NPDC058409 TaxID=3346484 RepID=UPI00364F169A
MERSTLQVSKRIGLYPRVRVEGGGSGAVSQAGAVLLAVKANSFENDIRLRSQTTCQPHLRSRLHDPDTARAARRVAAWADGLRQRGFIGEITFDTYHPETGRYGSGAAMTAAEALFSADSAAVVARLRALSATDGLHRQALTAASVINLAAAMTGSASAGVRWLTDHPELTTNMPMRDPKCASRRCGSPTARPCIRPQAATRSRDHRRLVGAVSGRRPVCHPPVTGLGPHLAAAHAPARVI